MSEPLIHSPAWAEVAQRDEAEIKEYVLTGYKDGKPFASDDFHLCWPVLRWGRILDFGCGLGRNFPILRKMSHELVGIDIPEMITACRKYATVSNVKLTSNLTEITDNKFDLVAATLVLQHIEDRTRCDAILKALARCCGFLYLLTRLWCDGEQKDNIFERISSSGVWEYYKGHVPERELLRMNYPNDTHACVMYRSRNPEMREMSNKGPTESFKPPSPEVRVGFITPSMVHPGGAEQWIKTLIEGWSCRVGRSGVVVTGPARSLEMIRTVEDHCPVMFGLDSIPLLLEKCDVVLTWGEENLAKLVQGFEGKIVLVSHGCCDWTRQIMKQAAAAADHLVAVSRMATTVFPDSREVEVILNGIDPARVRPLRVRDACRSAIGIAPHEKAVGYMGRFSFEKNPVAAAKAVQRLGNPFRAVYLGSGWQEKEVVAEIRRETPNAVILPPSADVADVLNALDCFVLASPAEGMSLSLIEAWMAKVPVVCTHVGAVPELTEEFGQLNQQCGLYPSREDLAEKVGWAVDPAGKPITDRAYNMAMQHLTAERMCQDYENMIFRVHADKRPHVRIKQSAKVVKVGVVTPSLTFPGGAERWILSLLKSKDPRIHYEGVAVLGSDRHWSCVDEAVSYSCPVMFGYHATQLLARQCDVIVSWGINDLMETYLPDFVGKVVAVAQGSGQRTADILTKIGRTAHATVGISKFAAAAFPDKCQHIIYNGFDPARVRPTLSREKVRKAVWLKDNDVAVGYVGRYSEEKNCLAALEAVKTLGEPYRAVYMGDGPMRQEVEDALQEDETAIRLDASGDVANVMSALDVFVLVSPAEGGGIAFAEAWAMRIPLVCTPVGIVPELQERYGELAHIVPIRSRVEKLAAAIEQAANATSGQMLRKAEQVAWEELTIEAMNRKYANLFVSLVR